MMRHALPEGVASKWCGEKARPSPSLPHLREVNHSNQIFVLKTRAAEDPLLG